MKTQAETLNLKFIRTLFPIILSFIILDIYSFAIIYFNTRYIENCVVDPLYSVIYYFQRSNSDLDYPCISSMYLPINIILSLIVTSIAYILINKYLTLIKSKTYFHLIIKLFDVITAVGVLFYLSLAIFMITNPPQEGLL